MTGKTWWVDTDFGPEDKEDPELTMQRYISDGKLEMIKPRDVVWINSSKMAPGVDFLKRSIQPHHIRDQNNSDVFAAALSIVASREELICGGVPGLEIGPSMMVDRCIADAHSDAIYPPIFHKFREQGIYCLRFFERG